MYVVGRVNSGKSTFVNRFLWYIGYKLRTYYLMIGRLCPLVPSSQPRHQGAVHYKRAVGGVTRSPVTQAQCCALQVPEES